MPAIGGADFVVSSLREGVACRPWRLHGWFNPPSNAVGVRDPLRLGVGVGTSVAQTIGGFARSREVRQPPSSDPEVWQIHPVWWL